MFVSPFHKLSISRQKRMTIFLLVFVIVMIAIMRFFDAPLKNETAPNGIVSFELAKELSNSKAILYSWSEFSKPFANLSMTFDFLFLVIYSLFLSLVTHRLNEKVWKKGKTHQFGIVICYLIFLAAFFDVIENIALMQLLKGNLQQIWSSIAYYFAVMKFGLLVLGLVFIVVSFVKMIIKKFNSSTV